KAIPLKGQGFLPISSPSLQTLPRSGRPNGKSLRGQGKWGLSSPSLQTSFSPPHAAAGPAGAVLSARGLLAHIAGAPIDTPANTTCARQPRPAAPAPDCPGSRHLAAAWRAASAGAAFVDTLSCRNRSDRELAAPAGIPPRPRTPAVSPSLRPPPANFGRSPLKTSR